MTASVAAVEADFVTSLARLFERTVLDSLFVWLSAPVEGRAESAAAASAPSASAVQRDRAVTSALRIGEAESEVAGSESGRHWLAFLLSVFVCYWLFLFLFFCLVRGEKKKGR